MTNSILLSEIRQPSRKSCLASPITFAVNKLKQKISHKHYGERKVILSLFYFKTKCLVARKTILMVIQNILVLLSKVTLSWILIPSMRRCIPTEIINLMSNNRMLSYCFKGIRIKFCGRVMNWVQMPWRYMRILIVVYLLYQNLF